MGADSARAGAFRLPSATLAERACAVGSRSVARFGAACSFGLKAAGEAVSVKMRLLLLLLVAASAVVRSEASANLGGVPSKRLKMQYATGPLLKFQIW